MGGKCGAVVRALASHQCGPGSNPGVDAICGLSLLLVLSFAPRGFSPGTPVFPSASKTNISKFQFDQESGRRRTTRWMWYLQIVKKKNTKLKQDTKLKLSNASSPIAEIKLEVLVTNKLTINYDNPAQIQFRLKK